MGARSQPSCKIIPMLESWRKFQNISFLPIEDIFQKKRKLWNSSLELVFSKSK